MTSALLHPALILILGGLLQTVLPAQLRRIFLLALPCSSCIFFTKYRTWTVWKRTAI